MARTLINPDGMWKHNNFSQVAIGTGTIVCIAGLIANDEDGNIVGDDLVTQVKFCMRKLEIALEAAGATWDDVVRRTIYTSRMHEARTIAPAIAEVTGPIAHPPQTIIGVTFARPEVLVEIECTAVIG